MANLSDAFGILKVTAKDLETAKHIADIMFKAYEKTDYGMWKSSETEPYRVNGNTVETDFYGTGRWSFSNNIVWIREFNNYPKYNVLTQKEVDYLKKENFEIIYEYTDIELGCDLFCDGVSVIKHNSEEDLKQCSIITDRQGVDIDLYTVVTKLGYTINEALDYLGVYEIDELEDDKWTLERIADGICKFVSDDYNFKNMKFEDSINELFGNSEFLKDIYKHYLTENEKIKDAIRMYSR